MKRAGTVRRGLGLGGGQPFPLATVARQPHGALRGMYAFLRSSLHTTPEGSLRRSVRSSTGPRSAAGGRYRYAPSAWRGPAFTLLRSFASTTKDKKGTSAEMDTTTPTDADELLRRGPRRESKPSRQLGQATIYHYPLSRSSNGAIRLLEAACNLRPRVIDIVAQPLQRADVWRLMEALGITDPRDFMRVNDPLYRELGLDNPSLSADELVQEITKHPRLMKRPVVDFPYREGGKSKRKVLIAQPPQRLFTVILNETEEEALSTATSKPVPESESDRWAREWNEREGEKVSAEEIKEATEALSEPGENYEFPEETDEMTYEELNAYNADSDLQLDEESMKEAELKDNDLEEFLNEHGLIDDESKEEDDEDEGDELLAKIYKDDEDEGEDEEDDPEFNAKMDQLIQEMAFKSLLDEERIRKRKKRRNLSQEGDGQEDDDDDDEEDDEDEDDEEEEDRNLTPKERKRKAAAKLESELTEFMERLADLAPPMAPAMPPLRRRGHRHHQRKPSPPSSSTSSTDSDH